MWHPLLADCKIPPVEYLFCLFPEVSYRFLWRPEYCDLFALSCYVPSEKVKADEIKAFPGRDMLLFSSLMDNLSFSSSLLMIAMIVSDCLLLISAYHPPILWDEYRISVTFNCPLLPGTYRSCSDIRFSAGVIWNCPVVCLGLNMSFLLRIRPPFWLFSNVVKDLSVPYALSTETSLSCNQSCQRSVIYLCRQSLWTRIWDIFLSQVMHVLNSCSFHIRSCCHGSLPQILALWPVYRLL